MTAPERKRRNPAHKPTARRRILLISAYPAQSHRYWQRQFEAILGPVADITALTLPARYYSWRHQGSALSFLDPTHQRILKQNFDRVVCTSACNLCELRGLNPQLSRYPNLVYFHENQFAFPGKQNLTALRTMQVTEIYTALAADQLAFNSKFNADSFLDGAAELLKQLPDEVPGHLLDTIAQKLTILPVPLSIPETVHSSLNSSATTMTKRPNGYLRVLWNHRWEDDKGLDLLAAIIEQSHRQALPVHFVIGGPRHPKAATAFQKQIAPFSNLVSILPYFPDHRHYLVEVSRCHAVLSTAKHEFQGIAVMEAALMGLYPVVPNHLVYPEYIPSKYCYDQNANDRSETVRNACKALEKACHFNQPSWKPDFLLPYLKENLAKKYRDWVFAPHG